MAEHYEKDEQSFEDYSDDKINVSCVCSWSITDIPQRKRVINLVIPNGVVFNSEKESSGWVSDERLLRLAVRLRELEAGSADDSGSTVTVRALHASLRDYDEEARRAGSPLFYPPLWKESKRKGP